MRVDIINIDLIASAGRTREDMGDLNELAQSIKKKELIQSLAVESLGDGTYTLLAGGRRLAAAKLAGLATVPVRIYDGPLSDLERKGIELEENIRRKDLSFQEDINLQREIHNLQQAIHGTPMPGTRTDLGGSTSGHSLEDTAHLLGRSKISVSRDIKLAEAMEQFPGLGWDKCKNKTEALKLLDRTEERIIRQELARRAADEISKEERELADRFIVGDFFELVKKVPDRCMDLVEVDPPYGIGLPDIKDNLGENVDSWYNEVSGPNYPNFIDDTLDECWRVMNEHSWLIFWFAPEPWFEMVFSSIIKHGFKSRRIPGLWIKSGMGGQTRNPTVHLGNLYEPFFYACKGDATINLDRRGRSNLFEYPVVPSQKKVHPTEKPVDLYEDILHTFAYAGARILSAFAGSGNVLIAAANLNMQPVGYDLAREAKDGFVLKVAERRFK